MSVIDLGSGKELKELQREEEAKQLEYDNEFKDSVKKVLAQIESILDEGDLSGIYISGITPNGAVTPVTLVRNFDDLYKLQFVADDGVSAMKESLAVQTGLWGLEEE